MRIFHNVTEADRRLWKAPLVSQLFPFLWAEPHHADVSLFCEDRSWQNDFSNSRSRITAWVARFLLKRSWRTVPVARYLTNVSVCFIQLSKSCGESVLLSCKSRGQSRKEGIEQIMLCGYCFLFFGFSRNIKVQNHFDKCFSDKSF